MFENSDVILSISTLIFWGITDYFVDHILRVPSANWHSMDLGLEN